MCGFVCFKHANRLISMYFIKPYTKNWPNRILLSGKQSHQSVHRINTVVIVQVTSQNNLSAQREPEISKKFWSKQYLSIYTLNRYTWNTTKIWTKAFEYRGLLVGVTPQIVRSIQPIFLFFFFFFFFLRVFSTQRHGTQYSTTMANRITWH